MRTKSERLANEARLRKNRRFFWGRDLMHEKRASGTVIDTPTPCSCPMCGNPRKYFKEKTIQEKSFLETTDVAWLTEHKDK